MTRADAGTERRQAADDGPSVDRRGLLQGMTAGSLAVGAGTGIATYLQGFGPRAARAQASGPVKLGFIEDESGNLAVYGLQKLHAAQLAVKEINEGKTLKGSPNIGGGMLGVDGSVAKNPPVISREGLARGKEADVEQGLAYVDAAIAKDPGLARAYVKKAWLLNGLGRYRQDYDYNGAYAEMERLARKALEIDPYDAEGYLLLAFATSSLGRNAEAVAPTERALELNPSSADVMNAAAANMAFFGKPEEGAELCDRSFRLNPRPPPWYDLDCQENYFFMRRYRDVLDGTDRWAAHAELGPHLLVARAASQAELGRAEAAAATVDELRRRVVRVRDEYRLDLRA